MKKALLLVSYAHWLNGDVLLSNSAFFIFAVLVVLFIDSFIYTFFMNSPTGAKVNYECLISTGPDLAGEKPGPSWIKVGPN